MKNGCRLRLLLIALAWLASPVATSADSLHATCEPTLEAEREQIVCQVRTIDSQAIKSVSIADEDGETLAATVEPYTWTTQKSSLYYVAQTVGVTSEQLSRIGAFLGRAGYPVGKQSIGIATAGTTFEEQAPPGSYRRKLEEVADAVAEIVPQTGTSTSLTGLDQAIRTASTQSAARSAVIALVDSAQTTEGFDENATIKLAVNKKVALYFVAFGNPATPPAEILARLASATGGALVDARDIEQGDLLNLAADFAERIENGFILSLDAQGLPDQVALNITAEVDGKGDVTAPLITITRLSEDPWHVTVRQTLRRYALPIAALLCLATGVFLVFRSRPEAFAGAAEAIKSTGGTLGSVLPSKKRDSATAAKMVVATGGGAESSPPLAWLELVGSGMSPVPLSEGSFRIGRAQENDIRLTDSTVHRRHALLQVAQGGKFSIHDLGTKNGIVVNGKRTTQQPLAPGDIVELGEVKLRLKSEV